MTVNGVKDVKYVSDVVWKMFFWVTASNFSKTEFLVFLPD